MTPFALTHKAKADLREIALHTEQRWGKEQRNHYIRQLDMAFHVLAENPQAGKDCAYIRTGYRKLAQGSHIIFYRTGADCRVEIVRILHQRMDVDSALSSD